jgi:hypothetical protein
VAIRLLRLALQQFAQLVELAGAKTPRCLNYIPTSCMGPRNSPKYT